MSGRPERAIHSTVAMEGRPCGGERLDHVDYKAREVQPAKLSKWVSAFANSSGGDVYVGVDEPSPGSFVWRGFDRPEDANARVATSQRLFSPSDMKDNVHVRVFDDRVEVEIPGLLPGHVTPQNILEARFSRNEIIERLLHEFPDHPNKNVGEGSNTTLRAVAKMRLADPEIVDREDSVLVCIRHRPLDSPATLVLEYLAGHGTISDGQGRSLAGIGRDREMRKVFESMILKGAIERVPGTIKNGSKYRLKGSSAT